MKYPVPCLKLQLINSLLRPVKSSVPERYYLTVLIRMVPITALAAGIFNKEEVPIEAVKKIYEGKGYRDAKDSDNISALSERAFKLILR